MKFKLMKDLIINHTNYLHDYFATSSEQVVLITCCKIKIKKANKILTMYKIAISYSYAFLVSLIQSYNPLFIGRKCK